MKVKYCYIFIIILLIGCKAESGPENITPELTIEDASNITRNTAVLSGGYILHGKSPLTNFHFLYGTDSKMINKTDNLYDTKETSYSSLIEELIPGKVYYYCAECSNGRSTIRSEIKQFTTLPNKKPEIDKLELISKGPTSVIVRFAIKDDGGDKINKAGCYVSSGNEQVKNINCDLNDNNEYTIIINNLQNNLSYNIQAYSQNSIGESVSNTITFTTSNSIMLSQAGMLSLLMKDDKYQHKSLSFSGEMNGDDFQFLRDMMGKDLKGNDTEGILSEIDLTEVEIVSGGKSFDNEHFIKDKIISSGLFANCSNITAIKLPDNITSIEKDAFADCSSLKEITIPLYVSEITPSSGCNSLTSILVSKANSYFCSIDGVLFDSTMKKIVWFPLGKTGEYTLPSTVSEIKEYTFQYCHLKKIIIPDNVTVIRQAAFYNCEIEEIILPDGLSTISNALFQGCTKLSIIHLGKGTNLLSDYVFYGCPLTDIYINAEMPPVCSANTFSSNIDLFSKCTLHVPAQSLKMYQNSNYWKEFINIKGL